MPPVRATLLARRGISPRKLVLGVILAGSILFFFLILFAGGIAILREAAPNHQTGLMRLLFAARHIILRHGSHHK